MVITVKLETWLERNKKFVAILLIAFLLFYVSRSVAMQVSQSYVTAYEGAKVRFYGIHDLVTDKKYTSTVKHEASTVKFDTTLLFDIDEWDAEYCNLEGETTSVQIPLGENKWVPPSWVPQEWWTDARYWSNPSNVYEWKISEGDEIVFWRMEEWRTKWFFSIEAGWDTGPDVWTGLDEADGPRYRNLEVWFEIDISPTWYFEGQTTAYFAIAKVELANLKLQGFDTNRIDVTPESVGSVLTVYLEPFGGEITPSESDFTSYYYQNKTLNPQYFRDKVYVCFTLNDFGTQEFGPLWGLDCQGDVVTVGFTVTQFVVGEWRVKDIGDIPEDYERTSKIQKSGWTKFWEGISEWWSSISPWTWAGIGGFMLIAIAIVVVIVCAWLFGIPAFLMGRRGR